ncbi:hypothetical protein WH95_18435 [Kiloniella litopenaei]|uniref:GapR-like DNA-binding domain-containing protein n=1 Tax=Kiloniella litopenaei TaxID=1549748 RepID=A0A0M2R5Z5_9PROT|nr:GapR family DNA-binding domain-containing protein [Kiloniella litopenaei]KKJ75420.1 hypothetical protein WH95_18435 [Kiloniella litopenaei]
MTIADDKIKSSVERLERLNDEIKALNADKAEVLAEAKSFGLDPKVIKAVVRDRAKDQQALREEQEIYDLYWHAAHGSRVHAREAAE